MTGGAWRVALGLASGLLVTTGCGASSGADDGRSGGWDLTVYYTAVEAYHDGPPRRVTGCRQLECAGGDDDLGAYPTDFVAAVETEGSGRITRGPHTGRYLNWSFDVGFWLDTAPRDSRGGALRPFESAAADGDVLPESTAFRVVGCGRTDDGDEPPASTCEQLRAARWRIVDEFTPGLGGDHHLDLYVGEETGRTFTDGDLYIALSDAELVVGPEADQDG